jgi:hypothetical protein
MAGDDATVRDTAGRPGVRQDRWQGSATSCERKADLRNFT